MTHLAALLLSLSIFATPSGKPDFGSTFHRAEYQAIPVTEFGEQESHVCHSFREPTPFWTPDPPVNSKGLAAVVFIVEADGTVHDAEVIKSLEGTADTTFANAVKSWRFHPAMCGNGETVAAGVVLFKR